MIQPEHYPIRGFGTLASSFDTTDMPGRLTVARNCILRPKGAIKGIPKYRRLWAMFENETAETKFRSLPFSGYASGVGVDSAARTANKTIAVRVYRQGKNFLVFYDLTASKCRGLFYGGDDETYTSGAYDFTAGTPTYEVLGVGYNAAARWFGDRQATMLKLSNNVDTPYCFQLGRTATPGKWRAAGSNVAPATPVISSTPISQAANVQAFLTLYGNAGNPGFTFIAKTTSGAASSTMTTYQATATLTSVNDGPNSVTVSGFVATEGMPVMFMGGASTTMGGGITLGTVYYARNPSGGTFQLSLAPGGTIFEVTSHVGSGAAVTVYHLRAHGQANDTAATLSTTTTLPNPLATATTYYFKAVTDYTFQLAASAGGAAIAITTVGTGAHTITATLFILRTGAPDLTFTADATNFPGADGNSKIKVSITQSSYATAISSALSGTGTTADPYIYALTTGPLAPANSNTAIVDFVNADTKATGILTAATSAADATVDTGSWPASYLLNGQGAGLSDGFTNQTVTVYLRYFDTGSERIGYEGISSTVSNEIIIAEDTSSDILVTITPDPAAEGGRFDKIRAYMQFGEGAEAIWNYVGVVDNTSGTKTLQIGSNSEVGTAMTVDQNRPRAFRATTMCRNQIWHGGSTAYPEVLYVSKEAIYDEIAPEGTNLENGFLIALPEQTSKTKVTAIVTDNFRVHVHTNQGPIILDPANPDEDRHIPQVPVGALNPACVIMREGGTIDYLGSDLQVYSLSGARYGKRDVAARTKDAIDYILSVVDANEVARNPDRANVWLDTRKDMMWYSLPTNSTTLVSFIYDFVHQGVVGELQYPRPYATAPMEPERTEMVFADEDGNLWFMDATDQDDWGDSVTASSAFVGVPTGDAIPTAYAGLPTVVYGGVRYLGGYQTTIETGFIDLGRLPGFKAFIGLLWSTVLNSRAFVDITLTNKAGLTVSRSYGDIATQGSQQTHKVAVMLAGESVKIKLAVTSTTDAAWIIRNMSLIFRGGGSL